MTKAPSWSTGASRWTLSDYFVGVVLTSAPAVNGTCVVEIGPVDGTELWALDRAIVSTTSTTPTVCTIYRDRIAPAAVVDGTNAGNGAVADNAAAWQIAPNSQLFVVWTGCSTGSIATITYEGRRYSHAGIGGF